MSISCPKVEAKPLQGLKTVQRHLSLIQKQPYVGNPELCAGASCTIAKLYSKKSAMICKCNIDFSPDTFPYYV